jgi:hypothetical protein
LAVQMALQLAQVMVGLPSADLVIGVVEEGSLFEVWG